jgi:tyrosine-protein phosphatase YwqE
MTERSKQIIPDTQAVARFVDQEKLKSLDSTGIFVIGELLEKLKGDSVNFVDRSVFTEKLVSMIVSIMHNGHSREYLVNKVSDFIKGSEIDENREISHQLMNAALLDGMICNLLQPDGKGWQKGKLKMCFEFTPEDPAPIVTSEKPENHSSPLDEIRQLSNELASVGSIEQN